MVLDYFFTVAGLFPTRTAGKYPVRVRTFNLLLPCASAITVTLRNPGSDVGLLE